MYYYIITINYNILQLQFSQYYYTKQNKSNRKLSHSKTFKRTCWTTGHSQLDRKPRLAWRCDRFPLVPQLRRTYVLTSYSHRCGTWLCLPCHDTWHCSVQFQFRVTAIARQLSNPTSCRHTVGPKPRRWPRLVIQTCASD